MTSVFNDPVHEPDEAELQISLGNTYNLWLALKAFTLAQAPGASTHWKHSGAKFGWGFRISDKKRVLVYLLPRDGFFKVALVFGQKATEAVLGSEIDKGIREELAGARPYAEGRGIRIEVRDAYLLDDIQELIKIKIAI